MTALWRRLAAEPRTVLLDGFHPVKHALRFGADVPIVLTADRAGMLALANDLAPDVADHLDKIAQDVDAATLRELTGGRQHTAVAGLARRPDVTEHGRGPTVLLVEPKHLGNVGAVIRVAAGLGASAVLTTGTADPWHPDAVRGSAGLHFAVPVRRVDHVPGRLVAIDPGGADATKTTIPDDAVLAFGSERHGVPRALLDRADAVLAIPMRAHVSSYNLATSVAMLLYQWRLQGGGGG